MLHLKNNSIKIFNCVLLKYSARCLEGLASPLYKVELMKLHQRVIVRVKMKRAVDIA